MNPWSIIKENGFRYGVSEIGTKFRNRDVLPGKRNYWSFRDKKKRRLGKRFYATLNSLPKSKYLDRILELVRSYEKALKLTDKEWKLLGKLMTRADPACFKVPEVPEVSGRLEKPGTETKVIVRKKRDSVDVR